MRRAGYNRGTKHTTSSRTDVPRVPEKIETPAQAEEALSLDDARAKLAEARAADDARKKKAGEEHAASKAALDQAAKAVSAAQKQRDERERRERAASLPARLAAQQAVTDERMRKVEEMTAAQREQYAATIRGWAKLVEQRQGWLNDFTGKQRSVIEKIAGHTYERTAPHWPSDLRMRMAKAAMEAEKLLTTIDQKAASYRNALTLANVCIQHGPPRGEMEQRREQDMKYAVGVNGNGWDEMREKPYDRPRELLDWVVDPDIKRVYDHLVDEVDAIDKAGAAIPGDAVQPQQPLDVNLQRQRAYLKEDLRRKAEFENRRSPVERQTHASGMNEDPTI